LKTSRHANAELFANWDNLIFPKTVTLNYTGQGLLEQVEDTMRRHGMKYAIIVRVPGVQTGRTMYKIDNAQERQKSFFQKTPLLSY